MNKQTIINRLEALDLSQYPYFEIKELIRDLGKVGFIMAQSETLGDCVKILIFAS